MSNAPPKRASLLGLPAETRLQVFEPIIAFRDSIDVIPAITFNDKMHASIKLKLARPMRTENLQALPQTCHQLRKDTRHLFYERNTLRIPIALPDARAMERKRELEDSAKLSRSGVLAPT